MQTTTRQVLKLIDDHSREWRSVPALLDRTTRRRDHVVEVDFASRSQVCFVLRQDLSKDAKERRRARSVAQLLHLIERPRISLEEIEERREQSRHRLDHAQLLEALEHLARRHRRRDDTMGSQSLFELGRELTRSMLVVERFEQSSTPLVMECALPRHLVGVLPGVDSW